MNSNSKTARLAGFLYLLVIIFGIFAQLVVRSKLFIPHDPNGTVQNILTNQQLFRLGFMSDLMMLIAYFFLPLVLYQLLKFVHKEQAILMVLCSMIGVSIMCINMLNHFAVLLILRDHNPLGAFNTAQINGLVSFFLDMHKHGYRIAQIFFGLWLFPLGYLVYHSNLIPKIIGTFLMISCVSFLIDFFLFFLLPSYTQELSDLVTFPTIIGEFSICLWLLIKGVRTTTT
ncbi:DUF4386 domain-containing protein [Aureispira anguillae]|uniref:DUF4386 domain-containing protein n=1 Tax=Aureispira anguillae TaxID=2864201 RepID=A0A916DNZ6_9BACT|nr:DUF4386 domain-containing protein [Aureispira anguillae]BDS09861.1 DUF4386 domain-containing protein [Aureispira anguillae]